MQLAQQLPLPVLEKRALGPRGLPVLTDDALFAACGVRVAFTSRHGGESEGVYASLNCASHVGDNLAAVERNRAIVCEAIGADPRALIIPNQVHGTNLVHVDESPDGVGLPAGALDRAREEAAQGADGVLVHTSGVAALLNFADCLPLIIVAPSGRFAVVHAGWRGAVAGIAGKAVRALVAAESGVVFPPASGDDREALPAQALHEEAADAQMRELAADFNAYIGPHIGPECFEVGEDVEARFRAAFGDESIYAPRHASLARAVSIDLMRAGMIEQRIADAGICTKCHPAEFFSYRATGGTCGRHSAFAMKN